MQRNRHEYDIWHKPIMLQSHYRKWRQDQNRCEHVHLTCDLVAFEMVA